MERQQKIDQVKKTDRVSKVSNLVITPKYIDPEYRHQPSACVETETGYLEILTIVPKNGSDPYFIGRWDQKPEKLDLDIHRAPSKSAVGHFRNSRNGYKGHHTDRSPNREQRIFEVLIEVPGRVIFDGEVSFSNTYEKFMAEQVHAVATCTAVVIRNGVEVP
jgi:hypothetical protein